MQNNQSVMKSLISLGFVAAAGLLISLPVLAQAGSSSPSVPAPATSPLAESAIPSVPANPTDPMAPSSVPGTTTPSTGSASGTIVDVASSNPEFKTLAAAVQAAGLAETLSGQGPFTVFAPSDKAFADLPSGTLEELLKPENKTKLQQVLSYHVVAGEYKSADLKPGTAEVPTVEGQPVKIKVQRGQVRVNNAKVTQADVTASNGVIHVIDKVILPLAAK
jgi:uncharacterized surface protein with fasciclin (FAS1) repeats